MNHVPARPISPGTADRFFQQVEGLEIEYMQSARSARKKAWWVAGVACGIAALEAIAIASLSPIHTVEWRVVRVDSATGVIDEVNQLREAPKSVNEANERYELAQYVRLREGYAYSEKEYNFHAVSLMSVPDEQMRYGNDFKGSNPLSPQNVLGKKGFIRIRIVSVSVLESGKLGQVTFAREEQKDGGNGTIRTWTATIGFQWHPDAMISNSDRTINPLGFQVNDYHIDSVQS